MDEFNNFKCNNTKLLYQDVKTFLSTNGVNKDTPPSIMAVWVNKCICKFYKRNKPREKVFYLAIKYLDSIDYPRNRNV